MSGVTSTAEKKADSSDLDDFLEGDAEEGDDLAQARRNLDTLARNIYKVQEPVKNGMLLQARSLAE